MKKISKVVAALVCSSLLVGCAGTSHQDVGTIGGGVVGGLLGSQIGHGSGRLVGAVAGTLVGAYVGGSIGRSMDDVDRMKMSQALERNRIQQASTWSNPNTGTTYTVVPTRTYYKNSNQPCREYSSTAIIGGKRQQIFGHACRKADGSWKVVS